MSIERRLQKLEQKAAPPQKVVVCGENYEWKNPEQVRRALPDLELLTIIHIKYVDMEPDFS